MRCGEKWRKSGDGTATKEKDKYCNATPSDILNFYSGNHPGGEVVGGVREGWEVCGVFRC